MSHMHILYMYTVYLWCFQVFSEFRFAAWFVAPGALLLAYHAPALVCPISGPVGWSNLGNEENQSSQAIKYYAGCIAELSKH